MLASEERPVEENPPLNRETHAPSSSPTAFGRFRVVHQVGAGVLGPVFRAFDPETDRTVALKSFPLDLTPEQAKRLGENLARLATLALGHPSLVVPIAAGAEGSTAYLVEEYFVADSVDIAIRQYGPAPVPDAIRLVGQLAGGLDFAAAAGVHHGALHPRDVLVAPREVRMTGIGVAQALEDAGFRLQPRRPYSAPERFAPGEWGTPADVYSLAALAYELLTGRRPAASGDAVSIDRQAIPASDATALAEVFARAFSVAAGDRFPSALAFAAALKHALTGQAVEAAGEGERSRNRRVRPGARRAAMLPLDEPGEAPARAAGQDAAAVAAQEAPAADAPVPESTVPAAPEAAAPAVGEPPGASDVPAAAAPEAPAPVQLDAAERGMRLQPDVSPIRLEPASTSAHAAAPELPTTPLPAETTEVGEALLNAEPELPAPPPALDDFDLRGEESEPAAEVVAPPLNLAATATPAEALRFTDLAPESEAPPGARFEAPERAVEPPAETTRPRRFEEPAPPSPRLTPAYRPPERPRRRSSGATMLIVALMAVALAVAGGYYAASRYLGRGRPAPESSTPSAPESGGGAAAAPQGQAPAPSLETVPPEPSLPAAEPGAPGALGGTVPSSASPPPAIRGPAAPAPAGKRPGGEGAKPDSTKSASGSPRPKTTPRSASRSAAAASARRAPAVFEGGLSIASRPSGARVYFDGHPVGTTPMTLSKVSAGSHVVRLESDGYATWSGAVQVTAGQMNRVTASLDRLQR